MVGGRTPPRVSKPICAGWWAVLVGTYSSPDVCGCSQAPRERRTVLAHLFRNVVQGVENVLGQLGGGLVAEFRVLRDGLGDEPHTLFVEGHVGRGGFRHHECLSGGRARPAPTARERSRRPGYRAAVAIRASTPSVFPFSLAVAKMWCAACSSVSGGTTNKVNVRRSPRTFTVAALWERNPPTRTTLPSTRTFRGTASQASML